jgi:CPA2 family monovalent cation:H+ antiporter-2
MHPIPFLREFVVIMAAAVVVVLACHRLRIPPVVGLLITGLVIGPSGLRLVAERTTVDVFAEIGIVFLLFTIGLEFSLERLREVRRAFFGGGTGQAVSTVVLVALVAAAAGLGAGRAVFLGFLVALSSTAVVLKLYAERGDLDAPQGKMVIGILLFQDFLTVPMLLLVPILAGQVEASVLAIVLRLGLGAVLVVAVFLAARYLMPRVLHAIVKTRVREAFVLGALGLCLGTGLVTESFGFSVALGAFLAGVVIAESPYSHQVVAEVSPFRDVFNSLFFISVGMLLDLAVATRHLPLVLALAAGILVLKSVVTFAVVRLLGYPSRTALLVGLALAQVGEFSFVVANAGAAAGLLAGEEMQYFLAASILSLAATPALIKLGPSLAARLVRGGALPSAAAVKVLRQHVVIVGFGVNGRNLARVLRETGIRYAVLELDGEIVRRALAAGEPVVYGDATRPDILQHCGVPRASVMVFGISDADALRRGIRLAREMNPSLHILVRTRRVVEIDDLYKLGASEVIAEEFETSIEVFNRVLRHFHVPRNVVEAQEKVLRAERYEALRSTARAAAVPERVLRFLAAGTTDVFFVDQEGVAAGRTLAELRVRERTGASVIAVVRGEQSHTNPAGDFRLEAGDSVVLVGSHAEIRRAFDVLVGGGEAGQAAP